MMDGSRDGRRTDSRERIRSLALALFTEQGYGATSLNQIAERLGMTRAAVLHHFSSKEALLTSSYDDLLPELDEILDRLAAGTASRELRVWAIERFAAMVRGAAGSALICAQVNHDALRGIPGARALHRRLELFTQAIAGQDGVEGRMRARLAVSALVMADARGPELGGRLDERRATALSVARQLIT